MDMVLRNVEKGFSFFSFIEEFCFEEGYESAVNRPFHRLCSLMRKMKAKSVIIEPTASERVLIELAALNEKYQQTLPAQAFRLTFLRKEIQKVQEAIGLEDSCFLSSTTIINFLKPDGHWKSYVFESVVTEPKIYGHPKFGEVPLLNNYLHVRKRFKCSVDISDSQTHNFSIVGSFFCQQNSITSVCAHAALCMTVNNTSSPDHNLVFPEDVNKAIGIDHKTTTVPGGLNRVQMEKVLQGFGLTIDWRDFLSNTNIYYKDYVYKYMESKCPVILGFGVSDTIAHVVPILGHTLNTDLWASEALSAYSYTQQVSRVEDYYKSVHLWVDHFVIHDDNFGMYFCLPTNTLKQPEANMNTIQFYACYAIAVIPSYLTTEAWEAEVASRVNISNILTFLSSQPVALNPPPVFSSSSFSVRKAESF